MRDSQDSVSGQVEGAWQVRVQGWSSGKLIEKKKEKEKFGFLSYHSHCVI